MKWSELRRKAIKMGWYLERHGSNHDIFVHMDKNFKIQISRHGSNEIKKGLEKKLRNQIGL
jgi:predicted RNA binding protein YcfA (HicA-like mRNA interferase family)